MNKYGEFIPEKESKPAKQVQKEVYTPIEKQAGEQFKVIAVGSDKPTGANRGGDAFKKKN